MTYTVGKDNSAGDTAFFLPCVFLVGLMTKAVWQRSACHCQHSDPSPTFSARPAALGRSGQLWGKDDAGCRGRRWTITLTCHI